MSSAIRPWLETLGLAQYGERFDADDIDLEVLPSLSEQDLEKLGVSMGHRKRMLKAISELKGVTGFEGHGVSQGPQMRSYPLTPNPFSYTPKHLAEKILTSRSALEGERKQVTVLFADVQGSMELAEQLDPEAWHTILDRFFAILGEGVHRFEGTVNQYTGDGVMALFGAPIAHEDHAQRACYAALHLREEMGRYATEVKREHGVGFSTRMGLNSGAVVVGRIGDDLRMDYTAQGHTVGLAQRMESLAEPNSCYLAASTAALVRGYFALDDLGDFRVKGVTEPVRVHRLAGLGASRTRFDVSRARGLARFVGRAADLRVLEAAPGTAPGSRRAPAPAPGGDAQGDPEHQRGTAHRDPGRGPALARRRQRRVPGAHGRCARRQPQPAAAQLPAGVPRRVDAEVVVSADPADAAREGRSRACRATFPRPSGSSASTRISSRRSGADRPWRCWAASPEGLDQLGRALRQAEEDQTPEVVVYVAYHAAEACYLAHDRDRALTHVRRLEAITRRLGDPPAWVALQATGYAWAHLAAGRPADAIEPARESLALYQRVERQIAGLPATLLAQALLESGELAAAQRAAEEAIAVCRRTLRATYETIAHGVLARALLRQHGASARDGVEAALAEAAARIERTGLTTLNPALCEWRAELAAALGDAAMREQWLQEARRGYEGIGAPGHAERLRKDLGS